jgi:galactokinase
LKRKILIGQAAEHNYVGVKCGIMDQFASLMGKKDQAFILDCRSLDYEYFPLQLGDYELLLINSNVHHSLADSEYNVRRQQCEEGVELIKTKFLEVYSLRDVSFVMLNELKSGFDPLVYRRCKYVIEENARVEEMGEALKTSDLFRVGDILKRGQQGMREDYEITCPEIDFLADFANEHPAALGARMMGGGFGGCTLNLIKKTDKDSFIGSISESYAEKFKVPTCIDVKIEDGVKII